VDARANYRYQLAEIWPRLSGPLVSAETEEQIISVFKEHGRPYASEFVPRLVSDIWVLIHDRNLPKTADARIGFLADSLAGRPNVEFRTSRGICGKNARRSAPHHRTKSFVESSILNARAAMKVQPLITVAGSAVHKFLCQWIRNGAIRHRFDSSVRPHVT